jgi:hypothetical protein
MIHRRVELALSVKSEPGDSLSMNETGIAQAGSIAFSISSRGVESTRHAPNVSSHTDRASQMSYAARSRNESHRRNRDACNEFDRERSCCAHDRAGNIARESSLPIHVGQPMVLVARRRW